MQNCRLCQKCAFLIKFSHVAYDTCEALILRHVKFLEWRVLCKCAIITLNLHIKQFQDLKTQQTDKRPDIRSIQWNLWRTNQNEMETSLDQRRTQVANTKLEREKGNVRRTMTEMCL